MAHYDVNDCGGDGVCDSWEDEPECVDGLRHTWTGDGMGGCDSNPGVWSLGGTTIHESERCRYCGVVRTTTWYGSQRNPYQCDTRSYVDSDPDLVDHAALGMALRRAKRNRRARDRRWQHKIGPAATSILEAHGLTRTSTIDGVNRFCLEIPRNGKPRWIAGTSPSSRMRMPGRPTISGANAYAWGQIKTGSELHIALECAFAMLARMVAP